MTKAIFVAWDNLILSRFGLICPFCINSVKIRTVLCVQSCQRPPQIGGPGPVPPPRYTSGLPAIFIHRINHQVVIENESLDFSLWNKTRETEGDPVKPAWDDIPACH